MKSKIPILIDTDAGHDDALAMMLLLFSKQIDVKAITTVAGNSTIENVTRNAAFILDLVGRQEIPLYSGFDTPLKRSLVQAVVHGESGLAGADVSKTMYSLTYNAPERIGEIVSQSDRPISILTLGPLTNIALAFMKNPGIAENIEKIVMMGGAINVCGNKNRVAEFNIYVDPEAADIVFRSPIPKVLVPLDPCNSIILHLTDFAQLKGNSFFQVLHSMMKHFISGIADDEGTDGALVYDALAAYYLLNPHAYTTQMMDIVVETQGDHTRGMTVAEKRKGKSRSKDIEVVTAVDRSAFIFDLFQTLKNAG